MTSHMSVTDAPLSASTEWGRDLNIGPSEKCNVKPFINAHVYFIEANVKRLKNEIYRENENMLDLQLMSIDLLASLVPTALWTSHFTTPS